MKQSELLDRVRQGRAKWDAIVAEVEPGRLDEPVAGDWTVKDLVAHVTWYEREIVGLLRKRRLAGSALWDLTGAERNAALLGESRTRTAEEVLEESRQVFAQLVEQLQALTDADLSDPHRFADMPDNWVPWQLIADNTYAHYPEHAATLRAWLNEARNSGDKVQHKI